jgi:hypothetical protein
MQGAAQKSKDRGEKDKTKHINGGPRGGEESQTHPQRSVFAVDISLYPLNFAGQLNNLTRVQF